MSLPQLVPVPPAIIRLSLGPQEWEACLDTWLALVQYTLGLPTDLFAPSTNRGECLTGYLTSFYKELAHVDSTDHSLSETKGRSLQRKTFKLVHRMVIDQTLPASLLTWNFLSDLCHAHMRSTATSSIIRRIWEQDHVTLDLILQKQKDALTKLLDSKASMSIKMRLTELAVLMRASFDIAAFFITGSDFLDGLITAYNVRTDLSERKGIVGIAHLGLVSVIQVDSPNVSMLSDHLYHLRSHADSKKDEPSLLADLVTNTSLVPKLRRTMSGKPAERLTNLLDTLDTYRMSSLAWPRNRSNRNTSKGKGKARQGNGEMHMHRMSLVTQVQDLFPDLGSGFVLKLLDEYKDDVEQVTVHLLDDSLPPHLHSSDRDERGPPFHSSEQDGIDQLVPRSTPPQSKPFIPDRRNAFDDDELDRMEFDTARLHIGKRDKAPTEVHGNKAAILSALAAFDSDDDERDDTYDVEDVGGTVDSAHPDGEPGPAAKVTQEENDMALFTAYTVTPELFGRTFNTRRSQPRVALKAETGMTDEAIEGWAIMLQRDPKRLRQLQSRQGAFDGKQIALPGSAYRESPVGTETEDSDVPGSSQRGGFRGRGQGRGRGRGRGGSVAGPSNEASTADAQRRKEAGKSSRANHNRRDQRAKKMARGGFPG